MRVTTRRLSGSELDPELLALVVIFATGMCGAIWLSLNLPAPACIFHALTGLPCPTCGGTRAMRCLLEGRLETSALWNPLVFCAAWAVGIFLIYALIVTACRLPRIRIISISASEGRFLRIAVALMIAANWIYLIHHFSKLA